MVSTVKTNHFIILFYENYFATLSTVLFFKKKEKKSRNIHPLTQWYMPLKNFGQILETDRSYSSILVWFWFGTRAKSISYIQSNKPNLTVELLEMSYKLRKQPWSITRKEAARKKDTVYIDWNTRVNTTGQKKITKSRTWYFWKNC